MNIGIPATGNIRLCFDAIFLKSWPHALVLASYVLCETVFRHFSLNNNNTIGSSVFEGAIVLYMYYVFFYISRGSRAKYFTAAVPIITVYGVSALYFKYFGSAFKIIAVRQVSELIQVANLNTFLMLITVLGILPLWILLTIDFKNMRRLLSGLVAGGLVFSAVEVWPSAYLDLFAEFSGQACTWSDMKSIADHGRMSMLLYWEAQRSGTLQKLKSSKGSGRVFDDSIFLRNVLDDAVRKRNVHIIVLEGFFDLSRLSGVKLSRPAMHPRFMKLFGGRLGVSRSPVFGGHTAQAEFEVLTGVPAFADYGDVEFNLFNGGHTYSLPDLLQRAGYRTYATNSFKPEFFNEDLAYRGLGFQNIYFPKAYSGGQNSYIDIEIPKKEQNFIFDGDLLTRNLDFIEQYMHNSPQVPLFNYILGVYGHYPFKIDYVKRPKVINVEVPTGFDKKLIEMLANQLYYRSEAVALFLEKLKAVDPQAIVVIVGDHLPNLEPVGLKTVGYKAYSILGYLGRGGDDLSHYPAIAALNAWRPVELNNFKHYYIPELVLDLLTGGEYSKFHKCYQPMQAYHERYTEIMRRAVE